MKLEPAVAHDNLYSVSSPIRFLGLWKKDNGVGRMAASRCNVGTQDHVTQAGKAEGNMDNIQAQMIIDSKVFDGQDGTISAAHTPEFAAATYTSKHGTRIINPDGRVDASATTMKHPEKSVRSNLTSRVPQDTIKNGLKQEPTNVVREDLQSFSNS